MDLALLHAAVIRRQNHSTKCSDDAYAKGSLISYSCVPNTEYILRMLFTVIINGTGTGSDFLAALTDLIPRLLLPNPLSN